MATTATFVDKFARVNGLRLHYLDWGRTRPLTHLPTGPAERWLVMLHGLRGFAHGNTIVYASQHPDRVAANPRIRWVQIPGATHFVHADNLGAFNHEVAQFLAEI